MFAIQREDSLEAVHVFLYSSCLFMFAIQREDSIFSAIWIACQAVRKLSLWMAPKVKKNKEVKAKKTMDAAKERRAIQVNLSVDSQDHVLFPAFHCPGSICIVFAFSLPFLRGMRAGSWCHFPT